MQDSSLHTGKVPNQSSSRSQQQLQLSCPVAQAQPLAFRNQLPYNNQQQPQWKPPLNSDIFWQRQQGDINSQTQLQSWKQRNDEEAYNRSNQINNLVRKQEINRDLNEGLTHLQQIQKQYNPRISLNQTQYNTTSLKTNYGQLKPTLLQEQNKKDLGILENEDSVSRGQKRKKQRYSFQLKSNHSSNQKKAIQKQKEISSSPSDIHHRFQSQQLALKQIQFGEQHQNLEDESREDILRQYKKFKKLKQKTNKGNTPKWTLGSTGLIKESKSEEVDFKLNTQIGEQVINQLDPNLGEINEGEEDEEENKKEQLSGRVLNILEKKSILSVGQLKKLAIKLFLKIRRKCEKNNDLISQIKYKNQQIIQMKKENGNVDIIVQTNQFSNELVNLQDLVGFPEEGNQFIEGSFNEEQQLSPLTQIIKRCCISANQFSDQQNELTCEQEVYDISLNKIESIQLNDNNLVQIVNQQQIEDRIQQEEGEGDEGKEREERGEEGEKEEFSFKNNRFDQNSQMDNELNEHEEIYQSNYHSPFDFPKAEEMNFIQADKEGDIQQQVEEQQIFYLEEEENNQELKEQQKIMFRFQKSKSV